MKQAAVILCEAPRVLPLPPCSLCRSGHGARCQVANVGWPLSLWCVSPGLHLVTSMRPDVAACICRKLPFRANPVYNKEFLDRCNQEFACCPHSLASLTTLYDLSVTGFDPSVSRRRSRVLLSCSLQRLCAPCCVSCCVSCCACSEAVQSTCRCGTCNLH